MKWLFAILIILSFVFSTAEAAEEVKSADEKTEEKTLGQKADEVLQNTKELFQEAKEEVSAKLSESRLRRATSDYYAFVNYSPFDLILPSKYGVTVGLFKSADESWDFEYLRGSFSFPFLIDDLGSMTEQRISLTRRQYFSKSMYIGYGISYFDFSARLGSALLDSATTNTSSVDLVEVQSLGGHFALGTMWTFKHDLALSIEWVAWAQPIFQLKKDAPFLSNSNDSGDRDVVRKALNLVSYFPHFSALKIQFGMLF